MPKDAQHRAGHRAGFSNYSLFEYLIGTCLKHRVLLFLRSTNPRAHLRGCSLPCQVYLLPTEGPCVPFGPASTVEFPPEEGPRVSSHGTCHLFY